MQRWTKPSKMQARHRDERPFVNPNPLLFSFFSCPSRAFTLTSFLVMASCAFTFIGTFPSPPKGRLGWAKCKADQAGCSLSSAIICCSSKLIRVASDAGGRGVYSTLKCASMFSILSSSKGSVGSVLIVVDIVFSRWGDSWWRIVSCLICELRSILTASVLAEVSVHCKQYVRHVLPFGSSPVFCRFRVYSCWFDWLTNFRFLVKKLFNFVFAWC